jgi:hypothetical protein
MANRGRVVFFPINFVTGRALRRQALHRGSPTNGMPAQFPAVILLPNIIFLRARLKSPFRIFAEIA